MLFDAFQLTLRPEKNGAPATLTFAFRPVRDGATSPPARPNGIFANWFRVHLSTDPLTFANRQECKTER
ncbi:MAG: hypothetical protein HYY23_18605 [Verrucomicrobia bacterium]|nr:hypothetical protein [Verrucomicrobiota bacterium]